MLFDHSFVVLGRDRGEALREQVVEGVTALHLHYLTLLAEVVDIVDQQQFDTASLAAGQPLGGGGHERKFPDGHERVLLESG